MCVCVLSNYLKRPGKIEMSYATNFPPKKNIKTLLGVFTIKQAVKKGGEILCLQKLCKFPQCTVQSAKGTGWFV